MDATIIANIEDARSRSNFLTSQKLLVNDYYDNYNSYLYNAQQVSNGYMSMKQRVPMVLEYYQTPDELYTIEMYINPNELSFSNQKLIGKQVTRGGIFFHHYGNDAPIINISGHTGLAGMAAIEQLERIYNYSGTLLRYQNIGISKINNGIATPREVLQYTGTFNFDDNESSGIVADAASAYDNLLKSNSTEQEIQGVVYNIKDKISSELLRLDTPANQLSTAQSIVNSMEILKKTIGEFDTRKDFDNILTQVTDELEQIKSQNKSKISFTIAEIFDIAKKVVNKVTKKDNTLSNALRESYAFQIAWKIHINLTKDDLYKKEALQQTVNIFQNVVKTIQSANNLLTQKLNTNSNDLNTQLMVNQALATKNSYTQLQDNTHFTLDTSKATTQEIPTCDVYTCIRQCNLYSEPSFSSNVKQTLSVNGRFTAKVGTTADGDWIEHISGGYAPLKTSGYTLITKQSGEFYLNKEAGGGGIYSNTPLANNALFTYTESKTVGSTIWFKHKNGGWAAENAFDMNGGEFFKLDYSNCYRFTILRDDVMLYTEPTDNAELFRKEPCFKGALFTAIELQGNWAHWIDGGWIKIMNQDGTYNVSGFNGNTDFNAENTDDSNLLTSNNDITLNVQEVIDDCTTELQKYIRDVRVWAKNSVIKRFEIESGLADIMDELTDEWLPRLIFLYFEDRVYIGHFNDFKYSRKAETEDIIYNMSFTIHRIISVTSIDPDRFEQNNQLNNDVNTYENRLEENTDFFQEEYSKGNDIPLKVEILRTRCKFRLEQMIANYTGVPMTAERQAILHNYAVSLRAKSIYNGKQQITEDTPIFGNTEFSYEQFLCFLKIQYMDSYNGFNFPSQLYSKIPSAEYAQETLQLDKKINGEDVTLEMIRTSYFLPKYDEIIEIEMQRILDVWNKEKVNPKLYTKERKQELVNHATNVLTSVGARFKDNSDFKTLLNNVLYEYNTANGTMINPYNTSNRQVTSVVDAFKTMQNTMTTYYKYFADNKEKITKWIEDYLSSNDFSILQLSKYLKKKIDNDKISGLAITEEELPKTIEQQMKETNGISYDDFINLKSLTIKTTTVLNVYGVEMDLQILYRTNDITIQIDDVKGRYGFDYKQITIIPNNKDKKNDIYLQLYKDNDKIQENRIKIIT